MTSFHQTLTKVDENLFFFGDTLLKSRQTLFKSSQPLSKVEGKLSKVRQLLTKVAETLANFEERLFYFEGSFLRSGVVSGSAVWDCGRLSLFFLCSYVLGSSTAIAQTMFCETF